MVTTVTDNSPQSINTSLFSLDKEVQEIKKVTDKLAGINTESGVISVNGKQGIVELTASDVNALPSSTVIPTTTSELENTSGFITKSSDITGNAATATTAETATNANHATTADTAGTADYANAPTGFEKIGNQDSWGNQDGEFITDWRTVSHQGFDHGDISFRLNAGHLNLIIDGVFYQNEGRYKLVDENSIKTIMKPNYTTGRFPAGVYKTGQTVSVSASITTTRGNPVFISYSGDFNSVNHGSTVPWIAFELFVDGQIVQRTSVDDSVALESDNTPFAGNALAVLSAGEHTIRLDAVLYGVSTGKIQFQEQDNLVNLVAFEL